MAGNFSYSPRYALRLYQRDGSVWNLRSLQSAQALLVTGAGVNQATFTLGDASGAHYIKRVVQPHAMNMVELYLENRWGESGLAWRGYVDESHRAFDPEQGDDVTLAATGPVKRFEQTRQSAGQVAGLALAYAQNITGSAVLRYAAKACGYPTSMLRIHPQADSASGFQSISTGVFTNPDNQTWSSVVSAIQANSGIEWFFDEGGYCYWRQVGFLDPWFGPATSDRPRPSHVQPRRIDEDDIIHADFFESDKGILTRVEVRFYGQGGYTQTAQAWSAPTAMKSHLGVRTLIVPAPWIINAAHAQYLAQVLGAQVSAGLAQASVTIPADPLITIGSLVDIPALGVDGTSRYYVSSITYMLQWGGAWNMVLGLSYGRAPGRRFPYVGSVSYPVLTDAAVAGESVSSTVQALDATNPSFDNTPYTVLSSSLLGPTDAQAPAYNVGAQIEITSKPHGKGALLGPAHHGLYTVVGPVQGQAATTIILQTTSAATGYVTIVDPGQDAQNDPTAGMLPANGVTGGGSTQDGTGQPGSGLMAPGLLTGQQSTLALQALQVALTKHDQPYAFGHAGETSWDCSGLVAWAYAQTGVTGMIHLSGGGSYNTDIGPDGIYRYAQTHGATSIPVSSAQQGDLLFVQDTSGTGYWNSQSGYRHVAFAYSATQNYGADDYPNVITVSDTASFRSHGAPFNLALSMATFRP